MYILYNKTTVLIYKILLAGWNNLFFLWGVFRAKRSSFPDDVCVPIPSPREEIRIPMSENATSLQNPPIFIPAMPCEGIRSPVSEKATSPQNPPILITAKSGPVNLNIPTQVGQGSTATEAVSGSVLGSGSSSQRELQSPVSTNSKCTEGISVYEVDDKTMEKPEQHSGDLHTTNEGQVRLALTFILDSSPCIYRFLPANALHALRGIKYCPGRLYQQNPFLTLCVIGYYLFL